MWTKAKVTLQMFINARIPNIKVKQTLLRYFRFPYTKEQQPFEEEFPKLAWNILTANDAKGPTSLSTRMTLRDLLMQAPIKYMNDDAPPGIDTVLFCIFIEGANLEIACKECLCRKEA